MRVTSSSVFSPVRTRYVTDTQSGAWPARAATVRSRIPTSSASRGAMNSKETVGRPRFSRSAIRTAGSLPQYPRVTDAARHLGPVEVFEQREHRPPAGAQSIPKLCDAYRPGAGDQLLDGADALLVRIARERNVVAEPHDLATLSERANHFRGCARGPHRLCKRWRRERLRRQQLDQARRWAIRQLGLDMVRGHGHLALTVLDPRLLDQALEHGLEGRGLNAQSTPQLLARHAPAQRMCAVIRGELSPRTVHDGRPCLLGEDPVAGAARTQPRDIGIRRHRGFEQRFHGNAARVLAQLLLQDIAGRTPFERGADGGIVARMLARRDVVELAAGNRHRRARNAEDEAIVVGGGDRAVEVELNPSLRAWLDRVPLEEDGPAADLDRAGVKKQLGAMPQASWSRSQHMDVCVYAPGHHQDVGPRQHVAPIQVVLLDTDEIRGDTIARRRHVHLLVVLLEAADASGGAARQDLQLVARRDRTVDQRAGHDGAEPAHGEDAIDWQPRPSVIRSRLEPVEDRVKARGQLTHPFSIDRRHSDDLYTLQRRVLERIAHLTVDELVPDLIDQVDLRQRDHAFANAEEIDDVQVLAGLGHDTLVRGDDQHHRIDPVRAGQHVANEARVARNVHDADLASARQAHVGEAEVDRHPAPLLLGEPVRVDAGQRGDERRFAVVDVPRGAKDHLITLLTAASTASRRASSSPFKTVRGSRQHASFSIRAMTGGSPRLSAVASRDAGPARARSMVGRAWPGSEPPPAADSPGTSVF